MTDPLSRLPRFLRELKRRNVYKVAVAYLAVAFIGLQAARLLVPATTLPGWADQLFIFLAVAGFPVALVLAWAFELTPEGVRRTADAEEAPEVANEPCVGDRSIAVLPFSELGPDDPGTFTEGMHDALLTRLSNITGLVVISRTSVQKYRDSNRSTAEIARELGVKWVVEGGVQEMGGQIQVNVQLIDPRTETHAWAESYRRELTAESLFDLQSGITKRIARSLEAKLSKAEQERIDRQPTEDLEAYRLYVKGRAQLERRTEEGMYQAAEYFQRAIDKDSRYALAFSGLADACTLRAGYYMSPPDEVIPNGKKAARRALEIAPTLGEAYASLGLMKVMYDWDFRGAEDDLERAVALNPGYATAHHWSGMYFLAIGSLDEALARLRQAEELDPRSEIIVTQVGLPFAFRKHYESAIEQYRKALALNREFAPARSWMGLAHAGAGQFEEAISECQKAVDLSRRFSTRWIGNLAYVQAAAGRPGEARSLLRELRERSEHEYVSPRLFVPALAELGDTDRAFEWLQRACEERAYFLSLVSDPRFDELRGHRRFSMLLKRMGIK